MEEKNYEVLSDIGHGKFLLYQPINHKIKNQFYKYEVL
jgi:hypothetical protein